MGKNLNKMQYHLQYVLSQNSATSGFDLLPSQQEAKCYRGATVTKNIVFNNNIMNGL